MNHRSDQRPRDLMPRPSVDGDRSGRRPWQRASWRRLACVAGALLLAAPAIASDRQARAWAATCAACHGQDGRAQGAIPSLWGRDAEQLLRTMIEFKTGQRPAATVMHQLARGYSDDELRRITRAFADQPGESR